MGQDDGESEGLGEDLDWIHGYEIPEEPTVQSGKDEVRRLTRPRRSGRVARKLKRLVIWILVLGLIVGVSALISAFDDDWRYAKTADGLDVKVFVKYREPNDGYVPFRSDVHFERSNIIWSASRVWREVGYDAANQYMVICPGKGQGVHCYHYCRVPSSRYALLTSAEDLDQVYESLIKNGPFDCRYDSKGQRRRCLRGTGPKEDEPGYLDDVPHGCAKWSYNEPKY